MTDWHRPEDYEFPSGFPDYRWAWEFLRRNPDYRREWEEALAYAQSEEWRAELSESFSQRLMRLLRGERVSFYFPPKIDDPLDPAFFLPPKGKWRLKSLVNPVTDHPDRLDFDPGFLPTIRVVVEGEADSTPGRGADYPLVEFNLRFPLKPQLAAAAKDLQFWQAIRGVKPKNVKHHRGLWPHYLRLLDAALDDRTPRQVADVLQHEIDGINEGKIWDQLQAARGMAEPDGYLSIFLSTEKRGG